jgi:lipopolysaccharide export system protein LptA
MKCGLLSVVIAAALLITVPAVPVVAADAPEIGLAPEVGDIEEFRLIHADIMTLTRQKDKPQVFEGDVHIILVDEADVETEIKAGKITIFYEEDLKKLRRIEAEKKVRVNRLGTQASTELAVYHGDKNVMELLIDPHVKDARGELSANKITIYLDTDDVVAEGNVRGIVYPEAFEEKQ